MEGKVSRMRVSSSTRPSPSRGTLKSTRMKMRFPLSGRSRIESLDMGWFVLDRWFVRRYLIFVQQLATHGWRSLAASTCDPWSLGKEMDSLPDRGPGDAITPR